MNFDPDVLATLLEQDLDSSFQQDEISNFRKSVLKKTLLKKYVSQNNQASLDRPAIDSFIARNEAVENHFAVPAEYSDLIAMVKSRLDKLLIKTVFVENVPVRHSLINYGSCLSKGRTGPGASRGTRSTDFVGKMFASKLTYTDSFLYYFYKSQLSDRWLAAENTRSELYGEEVVSGSKISTVPKDSTRNRCICTEPTLNMYYQLGAGEVINSVLRRSYFLDLSTQPDINKRLALLGSIDGSNATLDLKDASDSIAYAFCQAVMPHEALQVLNKIRSKKFVDGVHEHNFNIISSMGNGFTFSLMTLLLTVMLDCYLKAQGSQYVPLRDGVFGDDIILPARYAEGFTLFLAACGFTTNLEKSFLTGFFRESCGGDYYRGHNVRGIYLKVIRDEADCYSIFNRLSRWSVLNNIYLVRSLRYIKRLVVLRPIPFDESDDAGIKIPAAHLTSPKRDNNGALIYRPLIVRTDHYVIGDSHPNLNGALIGALGGYVRDNKASLRPRRRVLKVGAKKWSPCWDYLGDAVNTSLQDFVMLFDLVLQPD